MILVFKLLTAMAWMLILFNLLSPFSAPLANILNWTGVGLIVAHAIELVLYLPVIQRAGGSRMYHSMQTLIFGYAHFMQMQQSIASKNT